MLSSVVTSGVENIFRDPYERVVGVVIKGETTQVAWESRGWEGDLVVTVSLLVPFEFSTLCMYFLFKKHKKLQSDKRATVMAKHRSRKVGA